MSEPVIMANKSGKFTYLYDSLSPEVKIPCPCCGNIITITCKKNEEWEKEFPEIFKEGSLI